jgi:hypothetical protein
MFSSGPTDSCMILIPSEQIVSQSASFQSQILTGCGAGPFPATIQLVVRGELPPQLLEHFPQGTALQFVLDGERIHVYSAAPAE